MELTEYRDILLARFVPSSIVATRTLTPSRNEKSGWATESDRSLEHNCWLIATSDPDKRRRGVYHKLSFDSNVDFPGRTLSAASLTSDRLTKKLLLLECLTLGVRGDGPLDAAYAVQVSLKYDWILRLRLGLGIQSFSALPPGFAELLAKRLSTGGSLALAPIHVRLERLAAEARAGRWQIPMRRKTIDWISFAAILGVTEGSLSRSRDFRIAVVDHFPTMLDSARHALLSKLECLEPEEVPEQFEQKEFAGEPRVAGVRSDDTATVRLEKHLEILDFLFRLSGRGVIKDRLSIDPFEPVSIARLLERFGTPVTRTRSILPTDMFRMMRIAAKWVAEYSDYVVASLHQFEDARRRGLKSRETPEMTSARPAGAPRILLAWSYELRASDYMQGDISLDKAVRLLFGACIILIGCFTARRSIGIDSVHHGCIAERQPGVLTMQMYVGKTAQDLVEIPVPEIMRTVVSVLERLSHNTRSARKTGWLFEVTFDVLKPDRLVSTNFGELISEFLSFVKIPPPEDHDKWDVAVHMLRRGHGIWYYFGMEGGTADGLTLILCQNDPNSTRIYFTLVLPGEINRIKSDLDAKLALSKAQRTPELQRWIEVQQKRLSYLKEHALKFEQARCEVFVEKSINIWMGSESVIGAGGRALYNDVMAIAESVAERVRIGSRLENDPGAIIQPLKDELLERARVSLLEPVIGSNMWCRLDPNIKAHLELAECLRLKAKLFAPWIRLEVPGDDILADFNMASNTICAGCALGCGFNSAQQALDREVIEARYRADRAATAALKRDALAELASIEAAILKAGKPMRRDC